MLRPWGGGGLSRTCRQMRVYVRTRHLPPPPCLQPGSLIYPGYTFYYDGRGLTWGGFYCGDGLRNNDLVFML